MQQLAISWKSFLDQIFPTGALVMGKSGIHRAYETGKGVRLFFVLVLKLKMKNGRERIVVTEFHTWLIRLRSMSTSFALCRKNGLKGLRLFVMSPTVKGSFVIEVPVEMPLLVLF